MQRDSEEIEKNMLCMNQEAACPEHPKQEDSTTVAFAKLSVAARCSRRIRQNAVVMEHMVNNNGKRSMFFEFFVAINNSFK
jgi:hypothetical protein